VHAASIQDRDDATLVIAKLSGFLPRPGLVRADGGHAGKLVARAAETFGWILEIVRRPEGQSGFVVLPRRWVVERTFAWLDRRRRPSKGCREATESSEPMIHIAMISVMARRLAS
jgi:transposase